jgi:hypothetical protein
MWTKKTGAAHLRAGLCLRVELDGPVGFPIHWGIGDRRFLGRRTGLHRGGLARKLAWPHGGVLSDCLTSAEMGVS